MYLSYSTWLQIIGNVEYDHTQRLRSPWDTGWESCTIPAHQVRNCMHTKFFPDVCTPITLLGKVLHTEDFLRFCHLLQSGTLRPCSIKRKYSPSGGDGRWGNTQKIYHIFNIQIRFLSKIKLVTTLGNGTVLEWLLNDNPKTNTLWRSMLQVDSHWGTDRSLGKDVLLGSVPLTDNCRGITIQPAATDKCLNEIHRLRYRWTHSWKRKWTHTEMNAPDILPDSSNIPLRRSTR